MTNTLLTMILCAGLSYCPTVQAQTAIPAVAGTTFAGASVRLPEALHGKVGVLVLGFSQSSRDALTVWGKRLAGDYFDSPTVSYYEMPVLASVPGMLRGLVLGRIKNSVSDRGKVHFLPILDKEPAWRSVCGYSNANGDAAYVLLVNGNGAVVWKMAGNATEESYGLLKRKVEELRARP